MFFRLKESQINNWWIADIDSKLTFFDILNHKIPKKRLVVVGYPEQYGIYLSDLTVSTNYVSKITHNGIITEKGIFYPFEEAHSLYLRFLTEEKEGIVTATNWKFEKEGMIADITKDGETRTEIMFDFVPDRKTDVVFKGYSHTLGTNVILSTFARKGAYEKLNLPRIVEADIYASSVVKELEKNFLLKQIKKKA